MTRVPRILAGAALLSALLGSGNAMAQETCPVDDWGFSMLVKDYIVDVTLDPGAVKDYLDGLDEQLQGSDTVSPLLTGSGLGHGLVLVRERSVRDEAGNLVGTQHVILHLVVTLDGNHRVVLVVAGGLAENQDVMDWFRSRCISPGIAGTIETKTEVTSGDDGLAHVDTDWDAFDSRGSMHFEAKFTAPTPAGDPASIGTDLVGLAGFVVRFGYNPVPVLHESSNRAISEIPLASAHLDLAMSYDDTNPGLALFDGTDERRIIRLRYVPQGIQDMQIEVGP